MTLATVAGNIIFSFRSISWITAGFFLVLVIGFISYYALASRRPRNYPPGPPTLPFLGNLHLFPKTKGFLKFHEWGRKYGSIIGLKLGPQNVVILNDYKHVQELFDKKGSIYSDRPPSHIANDVIYRNKTHILFLPYGEDWRVLRKTLQGLLNVKAVDQLLPIQNAEAIRTMYQILTDPDGWYDHIRRYSTAVILASVFGLQGESFDSPRVKALYHVQDQLTQITELGATLPVDVFPFLKSLPNFLSPWRSWASAIRKEHRELWFGLMRESKLSMQRNKNLDCFLNRMVKDQEKSGLDDEHIAYLGGTLMEAGSDTTASTLLSFLLAMTKFPHALKKCQEEVDAICGVERSPDINDFEKLSYLRATMNETLRWRPVAAGGVPHALTQDDYYDGYFLPKGTILFANAWSIHRTDEFLDADEFRPERFLNNKFGITSNTTGAEDDKRRVIYGFGAGRRVCSGQRLAENSLIVNMAKLVWAFEIKPGAGNIDESVDTGYFGGFLIAPKRFPLQLIPRSATHANVIKEECSASLEYLSRFD
ncbi:cytochrome P450 [Glonium stellatum]|uniref:Cytochrome P450 n=1 Tax=Glonium stellatum TaxID=574774 RepID=A0A8E2F9W1_9PEZI|nr:cytochrome P450 [Glonium stellatum]